MMIKITFPDNSVKEFESGITPLQIAESISPRLAQEVLAATVDGQEWDLSRSINADAAVKLFKPPAELASRYSETISYADRSVCAGHF